MHCTRVSIRRHYDRSLFFVQLLQKLSNKAETKGNEAETNGQGLLITREVHTLNYKILLSDIDI
jgi:hypothetical protein